MLFFLNSDLKKKKSFNYNTFNGVKLGSTFLSVKIRQKKEKKEKKRKENKRKKTRLNTTCDLLLDRALDSASRNSQKNSMPLNEFPSFSAKQKCGSSPNAIEEHSDI